MMMPEYALKHRECQRRILGRGLNGAAALALSIFKLFLDIVRTD
jgi:hypothetical protein